MRQYLRAEDLLPLGLSKSQAERVILRANKELKEEGKMVFKGKAPISKIKEVMGIDAHVFTCLDG